MHDILQYEEKLIKTRLELNDLIEKYSNNKENIDKAIIENKIEYLTKELDYLNNQLNLLKLSVENETEHNNTYSADKPPVNPQPYYSAGHSSAPQPYYSKGQVHPYSPVTSTTGTSIDNGVRKNSTKNFNNFELLMGKSLMGIFASVLIFISLILFATLVLPMLSDTAKILILYIFSFALMIAGIFLLKKDSHNKLYISISGCGTGAIFISLLLSNMYFKIINEITLYLFIFVWALFVCVLSKTKSYIFAIIGQAGITISILFGTYFCHASGDWNKLLFLSAFFVVTESIFYYTNIQDDYHKNSICNIFNMICLFTFKATMPDYKLYAGNSTVIILSYCILLLFISSIIITGFVKMKVDNNFSAVFSITNMFYYIALTTLYCFSFNEFFNIAVALLILIGIELKFKDENKFDIILLQTAMMLVPIISMVQIAFDNSGNFIYNYFYLSIFIIPFAVYGYFYKQYIYKIFSIVYFIFFVLNSSTNNISRLLISISLLCLFSFLMKYTKDYSNKIKILLYCMFIFITINDFSNIIAPLFSAHIAKDFTSFIIICLVNIVAKFTPFSKNWISGKNEKSTNITTDIVNLFLMICGLRFIIKLNSPALHIIAILVTLVLFLINSQNYLKKEKITFGIYVGIKFTILMVIILNSFNSPNYLISIFAFLFAILCIVLGFCFSFKSLRIYGLVLSLVSIAKLILLDITYDNTIGHALSFFVCGILCFVISTIYNIVDKKINKQ
ncbi:DUF2339 domain-containing protein [Eubacterium sp. LFL-14]|uniref:DUF2339 domain-containing protein n=1 Tax=Eubacterium album TaxID=2978477 RepID=A0ABT2M2U8_9FIRM|nr:DUF2339 domain-containing protein [Eubacterium sp. LFL-14]MCT7399211.1 DUF2339 domain-containing protein [Eubacterium sp. LFL-14]